MTRRLQTHLPLEIDLERADDGTGPIPVVLSTDAPIEAPDGNTYVLEHSPTAVDLSRAPLPVIESHNRQQLNIGLVDNLRVERGRLRGDLRLGKSQRAREVLQDILDRVIRNVSIGADVLQRRVEDAVVHVTRWVPMELSLVSVPADAGTGIFRSISMDNDDPRDGDKRPPKYSDLEQRAVDQERGQLARWSEIADQYHLPAGVLHRAINERWTDQQFTQYAVDQHFQRKQEELEGFESGRSQPLTSIGLSETETRRYSVSRALYALLEKDWRGAQFELECSRQIEQVLQREARGIFIPHEVQVRSYGPEARQRLQREMTTGGSGTGAEVVGTRHSPENFIEQLRVNVQAIAAGARLLPGLRQNLDIPKKTSGATFAWLAEGGGVTLTDLGTSNLLLSPKTVAGGVQATRRMVKQALPAIDDLIMQDLVEGAAEAIDLGILQGTGLTNQPTGVFNTSGVNTQTVTAAGTPTLAELVGFRNAVAEDNALRGSSQWITTSSVVSNMMLQTLDAGSGRFLIDPVTRQGLLGYPFRETNGISANRIFFGNWNEVLVGMWGVLDLRPDPYTAAAQDALIIRAFQDLDVGIRHPESFCVSA